MTEQEKIEHLRKHNLEAIQTEEGIIGGYRKEGIPLMRGRHKKHKCSFKDCEKEGFYYQGEEIGWRCTEHRATFVEKK